MKYYKFIFLAVFTILFSSCTQEDITDDQRVDEMCEENSCLAFREVSFNNSAGDFIFPFPVDPGTSIVGHRQEGECLILDTRFGGGCEEHCIYLYVDLSGQTAINAATTFQARLSHNNTDQCEALVAFEAKVDISFFKTLEFEEINLQIMDYEELIVLEF